MKPFVFKLQTALDIKLREEDAQKQKLHRLTEIYKKNSELLENMKAQAEAVRDRIRVNQAQKLKVEEIKRCQDYLPVLNEKIKHHQEVTENSRLDMERTRNGLLETMKERKVLEKLRTRHYQEYVRECLREEQKQIDEMATIGYVHRDSAI